MPTSPKFGVYKGNGSSGVTLIPSVNAFLGRDPDVIVDFFASDTWTNMVNDAGWTAWCWAQSAYKNKQLVFTVPLCTSSNYGDLAGVAAGNYDSYFKSVFQSIASQGFSLPPILRIGHEANGGWYSWAAAGKEATYAAAFAHVAALAKSIIPGCTSFLCFTQGWQQTVNYAAMVPTPVPDYIGWDLYAQGAWGAGKPTTAQVIAELNHNYTLDFIPWFMSQYPTAKFAVGELGVGDNSNGTGPGDDAGSMTYLLQWCQAHSAAFVGMWDFDAGDYNSEFTNGERPNVAGAVKTFFQVPVPAPVQAPATTTIVQSASVARPYVVVSSIAGWVNASAQSPIATKVGNTVYECVSAGSDGNTGHQLNFTTPVAPSDVRWNATVSTV